MEPKQYLRCKVMKNYLCDHCMIIVRKIKLMDGKPHCAMCLEPVQDIDDQEADRWRDPIRHGEFIEPKDKRG